MIISVKIWELVGKLKEKSLLHSSLLFFLWGKVHSVAHIGLEHRFFLPQSPEPGPPWDVHSDSSDSSDSSQCSPDRSPEFQTGLELAM